MPQKTKQRDDQDEACSCSPHDATQKQMMRQMFSLGARPNFVFKSRLQSADNSISSTAVVG